MIRIVFLGKRRIECPTCKNTLEYENEDLETERYFHPALPHATTKSFFLCPVCDCIVNVTEHEQNLYKNQKAGEHHD